MKYYVTLSGRDADGKIQEIVIASTKILGKAITLAHNVDATLPKVGGPVCFVMDESGDIIDR